MAIVLGAAVKGSEPSPVFGARLQHAVELYRQGRVSRLILTGGLGVGDDLAEGEVGLRYALTHGVPRHRLHAEVSSRTTQENLWCAKQIMTIEGLRTAMIVSDPLHLRRAVWAAASLDMETVAAPTPYTRYRSFGSKARFAARETGLLVGTALKGLDVDGVSCAASTSALGLHR